MDYEKYLFEKYKDKALMRKTFLQICEEFSGVNGEKLYIKIVDYQIKRYYTQLRTFKYDSIEEFKKGWLNKSARRKYHKIRRRLVDD